MGMGNQYFWFKLNLVIWPLAVPNQLSACIAEKKDFKCVIMVVLLSELRLWIGVRTYIKKIRPL